MNYYKTNANDEIEGLIQGDGVDRYILLDGEKLYMTDAKCANCGAIYYSTRHHNYKHWHIRYSGVEIVCSDYCHRDMDYEE